MTAKTLMLAILFSIYGENNFLLTSPQTVKNMYIIYEKNNKNTTADTTLQTGWYYVLDTPNNYKRQLDKDTAYYFINPIPIVTAKHIIKTEISINNFGNNILTMKLDKIGTRLWYDATIRTVEKKLAFILDNKLLWAPTVNEPIIGGVTELNRGDIYKTDLKKIKAIIDQERK